MTTYLLAYRRPNDYTPGDPEAMTAWQGFFANLGHNLVDPGNPVFESTSIGDCGPATSLGGYSLITADSLEAAVAVAKGSPSLSAGGVEVGEITPLLGGTD